MSLGGLWALVGFGHVCVIFGECSGLGCLVGADSGLRVLRFLVVCSLAVWVCHSVRVD